MYNRRPRKRERYRSRAETPVRRSAFPLALSNPKCRRDNASGVARELQERRRRASKLHNSIFHVHGERARLKPSARSLAVPDTSTGIRKLVYTAGRVRCMSKFSGTSAKPVVRVPILSTQFATASRSPGALRLRRQRRNPLWPAAQLVIEKGATSAEFRRWSDGTSPVHSRTVIPASRA